MFRLSNKKNDNLNRTINSEKLYRYKVITHVHTQFSFDSLGKPSDIKKAMEENGIDFVFITDHNNDDYKYFEDEKIFAGVEKNTPDGRLLLLGNSLEVISHPHNFDFDHYKWQGEFKEGYLYEFIDPKDVIVWNKVKTGLILLKNLFLYPFMRNITRKWNCLIPIDKWRELYYTRAKNLNIIGGLDLHVKFVYQEKTHGILIPSYKAGFKWLINIVYSRTPLKSKEEVLKSLKKGNLYLSINQNFVDIFGEDIEGIKLIGENIKKGGKICIEIPQKNRLVKLIKDNVEIFITNRNQVEYNLDSTGQYWIEIYEYDFKIFNIYFGVRPVIITNSFRVEDE
ncbi:MAG: PHP domain-containing protein [Hydrogenothermaceae bacterium]|nr:PHP domain-containing protein [Hydrogenothermaceae bacterium]